MASLSNINGLFDVHSTGAILFSTSHGTSGQILKSNGNAAPTWIPQSDIVGDYLPLAGGTLTGATATASGISFTVGGTLNVSGTSTLSGGLKVVGPASHNTIQSANAYVLGLNDQNGTSQWWFNAYTNGNFAIHENLVGDKFTIAAGGNATFAGAGTFTGSLTVTAGAIRLTGANQYYYAATGTNSGLWVEDNFALRFGTNNTQRLIISNTGNATFAGNVTAPELRLQGTGTTYLNIGNNTTGSASSDGASIGYFTGQSSLQIVQRENDAMVFSTNSNERMRITTSAQTMVLKATDTVGSNYLQFQNSAGTNQGYMGFGSGSTNDMIISCESASVPIRFFNGGAEKMRIESNGETLIGSTSVVADVKLRVVQTANQWVQQIVSTGGGYGLSIDTTSAAHAAAGSLQIYTNSGTGFKVQNNGFVGIGTASPAHKLNVVAPNNTTAVGIDFPSANFDFSANSTSGYTTKFHMDNTGTYIGSNSAGRALIFQTNDTDRLYINGNTGNVGIGTTSPTAKLHVQSTANADVIFKLENTNTGTSAGAKIELIDDEGGSGSGAGALRHSISSMSQTVGNWIIKSGSAAGQLDFFTVDSFVMRLDESQNVLIGATAQRGKLTINSSATSGFSNALGIYAASDGGTYNFAQFLLYGTTTVVGGISSNGTVTAYNTSSDYRLKEDLQDFKGLDMVSKIPVYDFKWKTDENRSYGVMAHELQEVLPDAVSGDKDAEEMQGVDYSKIVPLLVKSIQELEAKIKKLENK